MHPLFLIGWCFINLSSYTKSSCFPSHLFFTSLSFTLSAPVTKPVFVWVHEWKRKRVGWGGVGGWDTVGSIVPSNWMFFSIKLETIHLTPTHTPTHVQEHLCNACCALHAYDGMYPIHPHRHGENWIPYLLFLCTFWRCEHGDQICVPSADMILFHNRTQNLPHVFSPSFIRTSLLSWQICLQHSSGI